MNKEERIFQQVENKYFKLLAKSQKQSLSDKELEEMLSLMARKIVYLQEEFQTKKEQNQDIECIDPITSGLLFIQGLKNGLRMTAGYPIQANIEQFAAHYQSVTDYEEAYLTFEEEKDYESLNEAKEEVEDLEEGYTERPKIYQKRMNHE